MTTTIKSLTNAQIAKLRSEAVTAGDYVMLAVCDLATNGSIDLDDYTVLSLAGAKRIRAMTSDDAHAAIVDAINAR